MFAPKATVSPTTNRDPAAAVAAAGDSPGDIARGSATAPSPSTAAAAASSSSSTGLPSPPPSTPPASSPCVPLLDHVPGSHDFSQKNRRGLRPAQPSAASSFLSTSCNSLFLAYDVPDPDAPEDTPQDATPSSRADSGGAGGGGKKGKRSGGGKKKPSPAPLPTAKLLSDLIPSLHPAQLGDQDGRIDCPNPRCAAKLGHWTWSGAQCSCGTWVTPGFAVQKAKVDITYGSGVGMVEGKGLSSRVVGASAAGGAVQGTAPGGLVRPRTSGSGPGVGVAPAGLAALLQGRTILGPAGGVDSEMAVARPAPGPVAGTVRLGLS
ncbi:hypothetical protein HDU93_006962 [Gonapodya sp. JEL0774]|nr:hypothetical protein HDU93_006962 [Gonapodya sp. JEL0774]